ncbi:anti-adapter protein IraP [Chimaeribacter coloradensis]|uniref:Anti-adapter protein IraP n=1 Tax=Chimaeribacter coloradensis TaxID=2060068 RepID=A0A2N5DWD8_9GAMM|nr:sigma-S stabilization anti-adapter protein IraP [Chimaeribacter coloradensis]PLR31513.1 anti-adapter protein IraP [Chimaeribacter coloradensis]
MKALIAELLVKLAENDVASKETLIQVEALQIAVTALMNALDAQTRATISKQVNKALDLASEDSGTNPDDLIKLRACLYELIDQPRIDP